MDTDVDVATSEPLVDGALEAAVDTDDPEQPQPPDDEDYDAAEDEDPAEDDDADAVWPRDPATHATLPAVAPVVHAAYHALVNRLAVVLKPIGMSPSEAIVLQQLLREPMTTPARLRLTTGLHRSTLSSLLDRFEARDWITRPRADNWRRYQVDLTGPGRSRAEIAADAIREVEEELEAYVSPRHRRAAQILFETCVALYRPDVEPDF